MEAQVGVGVGDPRLSSEAWVRLGFLGVCFRTATNGLTLSKCLEITSEPVCGSCSLHP